jgi:ribosome maturation factor RimP
MNNINDIVLEHLQPILGEHNLFLVEVKINERTETVRVFIDKIDGITIEDCVAVSRALEKVLNEAIGFSEKYALEVSSPGADQPFKVREQYHQYLNRPVEVVTYSGMKYMGNLKAANESGIVINTEKKEKKNTTNEDISLNFQDIKSTKPFLKY